ncbi:MULTISPECIES: NUDIX domain-containing protein [Streptomyces]|uniref:DNA mismatch repair protein MutT n=1 Tax=Streptomyces virginiae TaxID=1961 RepID=A0ABQ3NLK6_STRVG|nr:MULTISPECIES: NUDIX domain-containing protein [Streptomyces]KOU11959.1 DNA mismatch repair protein MutT [Streptomyces sp. WM6349]KOU93416.1 DNA mismatch repair protein MutT [Streptomyces sp. XY593]KOV10653.1 DNA mismatch repair protein MutT [Streptomyces sp. XY511]KOV52854.1 DNA mismatch repair protein MutT [Streptomyces sp. H036]MBP2342466.1 putative NUDIX family NTP pyrophosphohydrolase [Streptomyces virginiae]
MTYKRSAGLLLFRRTGAGSRPEPGNGPGADAGAGVEVLLGHMGGPLWSGRTSGDWAIPKGEYGPEETPRDAARREFTEEIGLPPPEGEYLPLGEVRLSSGKLVTIWAVEADLDPELMVPGTFTLEWPPHSGNVQEFPELDRVAWCTPEMAQNMLIPSQLPFLERLLVLLKA